MIRDRMEIQVNINSGIMWPLIAVTALSALILLLYSLALPGSYFFDDEYNLKGLSQIHDLVSAIQFTFSGKQLPGRPLALATFALQADAWPAYPQHFLIVNFCIHVASVWASFILAAGLWRLREDENWPHALWFAAGVAALWGLSPFLATTHLMIVQRMTSLAGLITLLGLSSFVWAHLLSPATRNVQSQRIFLLGMTGIATIFGTLAKENAALLPVLASVIWLTWIPKDRRLTETRERGLIFFVLLLPAFALFLYMSYMFLHYAHDGYGTHRYFTLYQRMLSQPAILLDYLRLLLLPDTFSVTPFMDRLPAPEGLFAPPMTLGAIIIWPSLIVGAFWVRNKLPAIFFSLLFFLAGHLLESTFFNLELYFAHRNYIPSFAIYFALVYSIAKSSVQIRKLLWVGFGAYLFLFALVLSQVTSGWNNLYLSSRLWLDKNPDSERAVQLLANQIIANGNYIAARRVFDDAAKRNPNVAILQIQRTHVCRGQEKDFPELLREVEAKLKTAEYHQVAAAELFKRAYFYDEEKKELLACPIRGYDAIERLVNALLENPLYAENDFSRGYLLATLGLIAAKRDNNLEKSADLLEQAFKIFPARDFATYGAWVMAKAGQLERAYRFPEYARPLGLEELSQAERTRHDTNMNVKNLKDWD